MAPWIFILLYIDLLLILSFAFRYTFGRHSRKTDHAQCWDVCLRYTVKYQSIDWKDIIKCNRSMRLMTAIVIAWLHQWNGAQNFSATLIVGELHRIDHHQRSLAYWWSEEKERRNERNKFADFVFIRCIFGIDGDGILCHKITQHDDLHRILFNDAQSKIIERKKKISSVKCWPHHRWRYVMCVVSFSHLLALNVWSHKNE